MALIKCPECGREISDKAEVCIGCGYPLKEMMRDNQSELQRMIDEVWERHPYSKVDCIVELQKMGVDLKIAKEAMDRKFKTDQVKQALAQKKADDRAASRENLEKFRNACQTVQSSFGGSKVPRCPKCHSTSISYQNKVSVGRAAVGGALAGPTGAVLGGLTGKKGYAVCLNCGKRWKI